MPKKATAGTAPKKAKKEAAAAAKTFALTWEIFCEWTGLSQRRLQQLAAERFFPPPVGGIYDLEKAVTGMLRYYRELAEKAKGNIMELKQANLEKQNRRLDIEIKKIEGEMIEMRDVDEAFMRIGLLLKAILFAALEQELPAKASGKTPEEIRLIARGIGDRMCECFATERDKWQQKQ
jgi:hypothetical protein